MIILLEVLMRHLKLVIISITVYVLALSDSLKLRFTGIGLLVAISTQVMY